MCQSEAPELVTTERTAMIVYMLADGYSLTTAQVAAIAEVHRSTAYRMLAKISRVTPLRYDYDTGEWAMMKK